MSEIQFDFSKKFTKKKLAEFSDIAKQMSRSIGFKVSSRGWCYLMEQRGYINKSQFNKVADAINTCRKEGYLPVDFVADEDSRMFSGVETEYGGDAADILDWMLRDVMTGHRYYTPDWWEGEEYYIQMLVEKIDLKTLFEPVCKKYHIPVANAKGWSSILQRAEYARRFKEAEERGLKCVLLYCGDHDPDGLRISDTIRKNLEDVQDVFWHDNQKGYDPADLEIHRFGLNYDFIIKNKYTWIDNLITGSGLNLNDKKHRNHDLPYVQHYLKKIGARKCEANAIVTTPKIAREFVESEIIKWVGTGALKRFEVKLAERRDEYIEVLNESGLSDGINKFLDNR